MSWILSKIDATTMYRVVLYVLGTWIIYAFTLSFFGVLYYTPLMMAVSLLVLIVTVTSSHYLLKWSSGATGANIESSLITAFILFLVFDPTTNIAGLIGLAIVGVIAVTSKYLFVWRKVHLVNPVAATMVLSALLAGVYSTWWIGSFYFFPLVLVGGLIITQKIRRFELVSTTIVVSFISYLLAQLLSNEVRLDTISFFFFSWPIIFFATVMVTEPLSTPAGKRNQIMYGALIGVLSVIPFSVGPIYNSLGLTLVIANLVFFPTMLTGRLKLTLIGRKQIAQNIHEFIFKPSFAVGHRAGQYLEWALPHSADNRGIKRYFTIASAPEEEHIVLGVKTYDNMSSYKAALTSLQTGDTLTATSLDGDFILPKDPTSVPLVFIAGGIGVTPFRSMVSHLLLTNTKVDATLFYCVRNEDEIAWSEIWTEAARIGLRTIYVVSDPQDGWTGERGFITGEMLAKHLTDITNATYYLSGPPAMVRSYTALLKENNVPARKINRDYFPGLA